MASPAETVEMDHEDGPILTPVLGYRFALKWQHLLVCALFGTLLLFLNYLPLRNTDIWGHVLIGRWIGEHQVMPAEDPFFPLAEGMRYVDYCWLAQVIFAKVEQYTDGKGLSNLFAVVVWLTYLLYARTFFLQSRSLAVTIGTLLVTLGVGWSRLTTIRPEIFSLLSFAVLMWLLARRENWPIPGDESSEVTDQSAAPPGWLLWLAVPPLFAAWANLHGTFVGGLITLGCYALGRGCDVLLHTRSLRAALTDSSFRRWILLTEWALAATLVTPYGVDLWIEVLRFSGNPILRDITEWNSMVMLAVGGREFVGGIVLLMFVLRLSKRRVYAREVLLLLTFGLLALLQVRMVGWFAPVLGLVMAPHLADIAWRLWPARVDEAALAATLPPGELPPGRSFRYTLLCMTIAWIFFAFSGLGESVLGSTRRNDKSLYGSAPLELTAYLQEHPPEGLVFAPQWWGDWLMMKGPEGLKPFMTTNMHLAPRQVWNDYRRIAFADGSFDLTLDRYRVAKVVVDKQLQPQLAAAMIRLNGWVNEYEDEQAAVYRRAPKKEQPK